MTRVLDILRRLSREQGGFTMIIALGVMFVTGLLVVAAFTTALGDTEASHENTSDKQAYYAALAGIQQYEYKLEANPNYWETCEAPKSTVPAEASERYEVKLLPVTEGTPCSTSNPFETMIQQGGSAANTFRIESIGYSGKSVRKIISTFGTTGFLDYLWFTNYEQEDPEIAGTGSQCENKHYAVWYTKEKLKCQEIEWASGDGVNGPMHTNDAADVGGAVFGRSGQSPPDAVEINGGTYPSSSCSGSTKYYTATKCYTKGPELLPPATDESLSFYVEAANTFEGVTYLELKGASNQIKVEHWIIKSGKEEKVSETVAWPKNGLIYVKPSSSFTCTYSYQTENADNSTEEKNEKGCGTVYVKGTYSTSLTVAAQENLIINGSLIPSNLEGKEGNEPSGTATLGLIATDYVRVYHPCSSGTNGSGSLSNVWIYAAILATGHSWVVDNYKCGSSLGKLHEYGSIAQNYRGPVGTGGGTGYLKDYKYDERLATEEPPYFLAPLKTGWRIIRETAPKPG
jgi:hypothetical protein